MLLHKFPRVDTHRSADGGDGLNATVDALDPAYALPATGGADPVELQPQPGESPARRVWELGYDLVFAEDTTGNSDIAMHVNSVQQVFPRIGRVRKTADVVAALE